MFTPDPYKRYQAGMAMDHLYPVIDNGLCACGCGEPLTGRKKRWFSAACQERAYETYLLVKGDNQEIRRQVFARDKGTCAHCGQVHEEWHADHIVPVHKGGGYCDLDNLQTLCKPCHVVKGMADKDSQINLYSLQESSTFFSIRF